MKSGRVRFIRGDAAARVDGDGVVAGVGDVEVAAPVDRDPTRSVDTVCDLPDRGTFFPESGKISTAFSDEELHVQEVRVLGPRRRRQPTRARRSRITRRTRRNGTTLGAVLCARDERRTQRHKNDRIRRSHESAFRGASAAPELGQPERSTVRGGVVRPESTISKPKVDLLSKDLRPGRGQEHRSMLTCAVCCSQPPHPIRGEGATPRLCENLPNLDWLAPLG